MTHVAQVFCPMCYLLHGRKNMAYDSRGHGMDKYNFWERVRDTHDSNHAFGKVQETRDPETGQRMVFIRFITDPQEVPEYFNPMKEQLLLVLHDWVARGWLTTEEVQGGLNA